MSAAETAVRERPILFSGPMVRAILDGRKTQTRRVVTHRWAREWLAPGMFSPEYVALPENGLSPYGYAGDRLWVRETWGVVEWRTIIGMRSGMRGETVYRAGPHSFGRDVPHGWTDGNRWRPSIHMPRWASRLTLDVTGVRVERVQDISEEDALAEGVEGALVSGVLDGEPGEYVVGPARDEFRTLWDSLNAARGYGWDANPWVWVVEFQRAPQDGAA